MSPSKAIVRRGAGRVAYFAVRPQVEKLLAAGHDVAAIYARLSDRMPIGYKQFAKYVQRFSDKSQGSSSGLDTHRQSALRGRTVPAAAPRL